MLVYDVGMCNGDDTAYYLWRNCRVVGIEANPLMATRCRELFAAEIAAGRLTVLNLAVAEEEGEAPFWVCEPHPEWSSFDRSIASREGSSHHQITVPCRTIGSILSEFGLPHYMKIDIEGHDAVCLRGLDGHLPAYVSAEQGGLEVLTQLRDLGYTSVKCISQLHFLPVEWPAHPLQVSCERDLRLLRTQSPLIRVLRGLGLRWWLMRRLAGTRRLGGWTFPFGSSGPFGEDTPGRWQSFDEMERTFRRCLDAMAAGVRSAHWGEKDYSFWADFHARR
jgi:FkbM family methyltransferase